MADKLSPRQHLAISALLTEPTIKAAAEQAGCGERTLRGWLDEPVFQAAYRAVLDQALDQARSRMLQLSGSAVATLERNMTCGRPAIEVSAANSILDKALKFKELGDLAARLEALEARHAEKL